MIRNILYSLFLHLSIALLVYTNLKFYKYKEEDNEFKTTVSFLVKVKEPEKVITEQNIKEVEKDKQKIKSEEREKKKVKKKKPQAIKKEDKQKSKNYKKEKIVEKKEELKEEIVKTRELPELEDGESLSDLTQDEQILNVTNLSLREKFNIQLQIKRCYKKAINESGSDGKTQINIHVVVEKDGTINLEQAKIENSEKYNDPNEIDFHIAVDNVIKALTFCSPLRNLPEDKHEIWRDLHLQFDDDVHNISQ